MSDKIDYPVMVCWSGGIDSTCLISYYQKNGYNVVGIFFDYGQPSHPGELKAIETLKEHFGIETNHYGIQPSYEFFSPNVELPLRNLFLLVSALVVKNINKGIISLGIHEDTPYYDCSQNFVNHVQQILDGYFKGSIIFDTPFLDFTKEEIITYGLRNNVPLELTYSCDVNPISPCGLCLSCKEREVNVLTK